jgi:hypothetical protein
MLEASIRTSASEIRASNRPSLAVVEFRSFAEDNTDERLSEVSGSNVQNSHKRNDRRRHEDVPPRPASRVPSASLRDGFSRFPVIFAPDINKGATNDEKRVFGDGAERIAASTDFVAKEPMHTGASAGGALELGG